VIFRVPGLGKFFVTSISLRDYPMIMATMLLVATLWSFTYLRATCCTPWSTRGCGYLAKAT